MGKLPIIYLTEEKKEVVLMTRRNVSSLARTMKNIDKAVKGNPSVKTSGTKVLRQLGVIKPQKRAGAVAQLKKLFK